MKGRAVRTIAFAGMVESAREMLARHGLDRHSGGQARQVDGAVRTGVPGDAEVGFPEGSLPTGGLPGARPKGAAAPRA